MVAGERIAGRTGLNPQNACGTDVLTRLMKAVRSRELAQEIGGLAQNAIGHALADIASASSLSLKEVGKMLVVGNTAMMSLLSGKNYDLLLQPEYWSRRIDCQPDDVDFLRNTWGVAENAAIRFIPALGGFIGSDLPAGVIATHLTQQPPGSLLIDFGTNSEIALWDGHTLHVTSAACGPAFEGSGIGCGMPGEEGAIYRVEAGDGGEFHIHVLGEGKPQGVCGSGLVDMVALLRRVGKLDKVGRCVEASSGSSVLFKAADGISLEKGDLDVFMRAKAAIGAGICQLCAHAAIRPSQLSRVYACGAFGRLLDVANAQAIGLLPGVPLAAVKLEGNTALAGCEALLLSPAIMESLDSLLELSVVYNMAEDAAFERLFVENLYLQPMQE